MSLRQLQKLIRNYLKIQGSSMPI